MSKVVSTTFISCDLTGPLASTKYNFKGKISFPPTIKQNKQGNIFRGGRGGGAVGMGRALTVLKPRFKLVKSLREEN